MEVSSQAPESEKILMCTDRSVYCEGAARAAIRIAKASAGPLSVLTVIKVNPRLHAREPGVTEKNEKEAGEHLDTVNAWAKREGIACDMIVRKAEDRCRKIIEEAIEKKITLIVMGRKGKTGIKRLIMGSVTREVIERSPCSVLVVPRAADLQFKRILIATDGSNHSMAAAANAIRIARLNRSPLVIISVVPSELAMPTDIHSTVHRHGLISEREMQEAGKKVKAVKEAAHKEGVSSTAFVISGKPPLAIAEAARDENADLIVVGHHAGTGVKGLAMGSVAERVIALASCAVLVAKAG